VARAHAVTADALALAWVLAHDWVDVALSGAVTVEQLQSNLTALSVPPAALRDTGLDPLAQPAQVYWETRGALAWN
jgi:aryl-alcohol dehydrogenase-like predicted oxidoreductase